MAGVELVGGETGAEPTDEELVDEDTRPVGEGPSDTPIPCDGLPDGPRSVPEKAEDAPLEVVEADEEVVEEVLFKDCDDEESVILDEVELVLDGEDEAEEPELELAESLVGEDTLADMEPLELEATSLDDGNKDEGPGTLRLSDRFIGRLPQLSNLAATPVCLI